MGVACVQQYMHIKILIKPISLNYGTNVVMLCPGALALWPKIIWSVELKSTRSVHSEGYLAPECTYTYTTSCMCLSTPWSQFDRAATLWSQCELFINIYFVCGIHFNFEFGQELAQQYFSFHLQAQYNVASKPNIMDPLLGNRKARFFIKSNCINTNSLSCAEVIQPSSMVSQSDILIPIHTYIFTLYSLNLCTLN